MLAASPCAQDGFGITLPDARSPLGPGSPGCAGRRAPGGLRDPRPPRQGLEAQGAATQGCSCHQAGPGTHPWPSSATLWQPPARNGGCPRTPSQGPRRCLSLLMAPPGPLCPAVTPTHPRMSLRTPELLLGLFAPPLGKHPRDSSSSSQNWAPPRLPTCGQPL